jgi:hypothetical protein
MSQRNWLPQLAFIGWLAACLLAALHFPHFVAHVFPVYDLERDEQACRGQYQQNAPKANAGDADAVQKELPSSQQQAADAHKAAHEYCIQRRAAKAAERQADYSWWSNIVVLTTLVATFAAVVAAFNAASAARQTVGTMQDTAKRELRARLAALPAGINVLVGEHDAMGHVDLRNVGKIPARRVVLWMDIRFSDSRDKDFEPKKLEELERPMRVIQPDTAMRQGTGVVAIGDIVSGQKGRYVYVWGVAYYDDGYGCERFTRFCHRYAVAAHNRNEDWTKPADEPKSLVASSEARFHTEGNDAD